MKSPLCLWLLLLLSLFSIASFARTGEAPPAHHPNASNANAGGILDDGVIPVSSQFTIPGPLRSFLRMAGISQKISPDEALPLLSRNIFTQGFEGGTHPTEFLLLLRRYVVQARELNALAAGSGMVIRVKNCDEARPLLQILGYRVRAACGEPSTALQTEDAERAFLTTDSGFPLAELEQTLQGGKPFEYHYSSSSVRVEFSESEWTKASLKNHNESSKDLLETILNDGRVARLYWAMSKLDPETSEFMRKSIGVGKMLPFAAVLDFYGKRFCVRDGRVVVPGGSKAENAWKELVGTSPDSPAVFLERLLATDRGWLAAYFDSISRASQPRQDYFTEPHRLRLFYEGLRGSDPTPPATRGSFRPSPALLLLATRLQLDANGRPIIPGSLEVWKEILQGPNAKLVRRWGKHSANPANADQLIRLMFALSRPPTDSGPLQIFMTASELDHRRPEGRHLSPATVRLLASKFEDFSDQFRIFSEFSELSDESIAQFVDVIQKLNTVPMGVRGNALGIFQANVGIWQILARQGEISSSQIDESWKQTIEPFAGVRSLNDLYDAGRASLTSVFKVVTGKPKVSQDDIIELLAGPLQTSPDGMRVHRDLARRIRSVLDDQRLVSIDTLMTVGDALHRKEQGKQPEEFVIQLAGQTREFEMPRPIFTNSERTEWAAGIYNNHHTDVQMRTDVVKVLRASSVSNPQIEDARGELSSFLRDTLVGLNYAYYEPPGSQALHNNPLFVRSHDFAGESISGMKTLWQASELIGQGSAAGGGAHFVGSLADLPYSLAEVEQDFISPENVQALIWNQMTPELLTSAVLPRWWNVTPIELHAIALYQKTGEELLTGSATDSELRSKVMSVLSDRFLPQRSWEVERMLRNGRASEVLAQTMPADTFYLTAEFQRRYPDFTGPLGSASRELQQLRIQHPEQVDWKRLSHDFGTPHPSIAQNYGLELLNVAPMPPFAGNPSRYLAESLDSPNLYWARLADEGGYSPVMLNHLVPELTRLMVRKIFATDFEDWTALLRAMHEAGDEFRQGKLGSPQELTRLEH